MQKIILPSMSSRYELLGLAASFMVEGKKAIQT